MLTTALTAIDATILATAVPTIVAELGGFAQFPWLLFSIYLLAQAVAVPIYAKLSDVVGRKPIILIGIALFLLGAIQPMAITIAGDIYTIAERAKTHGYLASVWGISSVVGPSLGGLFAQFDAWRSIFSWNVPLSILGIWMLLRTFHEKVERREHKVDYFGAVLLASSMSLLILAVLEGGQSWAWNSPQSVGAFAVGAVLLAVTLFGGHLERENVHYGKYASGVHS